MRKNPILIFIVLLTWRNFICGFNNWLQYHFLWVFLPFRFHNLDKIRRLYGTGLWYLCLFFWKQSKIQLTERLFSKLISFFGGTNNWISDYCLKSNWINNIIVNQQNTNKFETRKNGHKDWHTRTCTMSVNNHNELYKNWASCMTALIQTPNSVLKANNGVFSLFIEHEWHKWKYKFAYI